MKRYSNIILAAGDLLALLAFVLVGQADHQTINPSNPLLGALPNFAPLAGAWLVLAVLLRAYPRASDHPRLAPFLGRAALAWVIAAPDAGSTEAASEAGTPLSFTGALKR